MQQEGNEEHVHLEASWENGAAIDEPVPEQALQEVVTEQGVQHDHSPRVSRLVVSLACARDGIPV